jgi:hypothetical protein
MKLLREWSDDPARDWDEYQYRLEREWNDWLETSSTREKVKTALDEYDKDRDLIGYILKKESLSELIDILSRAIERSKDISWKVELNEELEEFGYKYPFKEVDDNDSTLRELIVDHIERADTYYILEDTDKEFWYDWAEIYFDEKGYPWDNE